MTYSRTVSNSKSRYCKQESSILREEDMFYLTKTKYNSMPIAKLKEYSEIIYKNRIEKKIERIFENQDIDKLLEESEKELSDPNTKYLTHEEIFSSMRRLINEE